VHDLAQYQSFISCSYLRNLYIIEGLSARQSCNYWKIGKREITIQLKFSTQQKLQISSIINTGMEVYHKIKTQKNSKAKEVYYTNVFTSRQIS
jgi:hypothetical protein